MTDVYKIQVAIGLTNNISPVLAAISRDMLALNSPIKSIEKAFGGWKTAIAGAAGAVGLGLMVEGLIKLVKHGGDVNHQLELMKIAGMQNAEIQQSIAQAMKTSGNVMTTTLSENLAHIRELRYAFGNSSTAMGHLDEVSKSNAILNAVKGGGTDQVWELVKSLEGKGLTFDPKEFSSYINTMTKVVEATGGKVTPQMFMSTFKYGRTATLGWEEAFVGGALPRLMQSMATGSGGGGGAGAGGPGNALMSSFAKVVQGQMPKTAAEEFERMGLGSAKHIEGSSESQIAGGIKGRDLFMANPYEWVQKVLMPALSAHGITNQNDIIAQVSKMFPVRTASQVITEMGLQGRFHEGDNSPFEKDISLQKGAMSLNSSYEELIKHDYPTVLKAFNEQFKNLLETLGSPLVQPGGPVLTAMSSISSAMNSMAQFFASNLEAIKAIGHIMGIVMSAVAEVSGLLISVAGRLSLVTPFFRTLADLPWVTLSNGLDAFAKSLGGIADSVKHFFSIPGGDSKRNQGYNKDPAIIPNSFNPGTGKPVVIRNAMSLNIDGQTLAQVMSEKLDYLYGFPTGAPSPSGMQRFASGDHNITGA